MFSDVRGDFMAEIMVYCFLSSSSLSADNTSKLGQMGSWMSGDELEQVAASGESTGVSRDTCQSTTYCPPTSSLIISKTNSLKEHVIHLQNKSGNIAKGFLCLAEVKKVAMSAEPKCNKVLWKHIRPTSHDVM